MKIKTEHYNHIEKEINAVLVKYPNLINEYEAGQFPRADKVKDLQVRFNNDLLFGAGLSQFVRDELYTYLDDRHISTAIKRICPTIERKY